jgi:hypothetical protein
MKSRISTLWLLAQLLIVMALAVGYSAGLRAATLVMTPTGWMAPAAATQAQVIRGTTSPFEPVEGLKPTDRVKACNDGLVQVGTFTDCTKPGYAPNRTDIWWLVSDVFTATVPPPSPTAIAVNASWPAVTQYVNDTPIASPVSYALYFGQQGQEVLAQSGITGTSTTVQMEYDIPYCGWVVTFAGGLASANGPTACHTVARPAIPGEGIPKPPVSIEFKTTVTLQ